ncbi:MAG TPA: four helix bundle protein [Planctomycetota bacterium]|nr:four helix bundle protein [Planctomycetota bacterium]
MGGIKTYRDLIVWQKSMRLVVLIYSLTRGLPKEELYGLTSQMRRAAVSIPSNIAEGYGRRSSREYKRFLNVSMGSLFELETQVLLARELGFVDEICHQEASRGLDEVEAMLRSLIGKLSVNSVPQSLSPSVPT